MRRSFRLLCSFFVIAVLAMATGCQYQWIVDTPGMVQVDEAPPAETSTGFEPEITYAELIIDSGSRTAYFAVDLESEWELDSIYLTIEDGNDEPDYFVADVDELEQMSICDWLEGSGGGSGPVPGVNLGSLGVSSCTAACEEACSCIQSCDQFPTDLSIVGNAAAFCTASCSQADGVIGETEFAETFADLYSCTEKSSCAAPQFVGLSWETNYPNISTEAQISMGPVTKPTDPITGDPSPGGEIASGSERSCFPRFF